MLGKPLLFTVLIFSIFNGGIKALTLPTGKAWEESDIDLYCLTQSKGVAAAGRFLKACAQRFRKPLNIEALLAEIDKLPTKKKPFDAEAFIASLEEPSRKEPLNIPWEEFDRQESLRKEADPFAHLIPDNKMTVYHRLWFLLF